MFTNKYIFTYASIMVILVAAILSTASMVLKPYQEANAKAEKIQGILASANIETDRSGAELLFKEHIIEELAVDANGNVVMLTRDGKTEWFNDEVKNAVKYERPFEIKLKEELALQEKAKKGEAERPAIFPIFKLEKDGKEYYSVPVYGLGLWGPVWGNIAFESDFNTIAGAIFDHKGETPGLGAEINQSWFEGEFTGKTIFDKQHKFVSVAVVKGGVANSPIDPAHGVDAISGGTITSNGVSDMLQNCLKNYVPYIENTLK
jgi:Na+-transporting NADH:ubiquinone oxidoreductase subunit C